MYNVAAGRRRPDLGRSFRSKNHQDRAADALTPRPTTIRGKPTEGSKGEGSIPEMRWSMPRFGHGHQRLIPAVLASIIFASPLMTSALVLRSIAIETLANEPSMNHCRAEARMLELQCEAVAARIR